MSLSRGLAMLSRLRRISPILLFIVCKLAPAQTSYYVDAVGGSDANSGQSTSLPWKTISKVVHSRFLPGDNILFKCGQTWREQLLPPSSGSPGSPITFSSYGSGARPRLLGSTDLSSASAWTLDAGNVWKSTVTLTSITDPADGDDVGNVVYNNDASVGSKKVNKTDLGSQGDFWFNTADNLLYVYSTSNPGSRYTHIEAVTSANQGLIYAANMHDLVFDGLDLRYCGYLGMDLRYDCERITVQNCNFSFMGGSWFGAPPNRSGQCFQIWDGGTDITVRYCTFDNSYDVAVSPQGTGSGWSMKRQRYYYNVFTNSRGAFEFWIENGSSSADSIFFENNTCLNAGGGWGMLERSGHIAHFNTYENDPSVTLSHIYVRNNIFDSVRQDPYSGCIALAYGWTTAQKNALTIDNNCFYQPTGTCIWWQNTSYTQAQFAAYQSATGKDNSSIAANPLLVSGTDYHLQTGSPCINAGAAVGLTTDIAGSQIAGLPDIGAFEHSGAVSSRPTVTTNGASGITTTGAQLNGSVNPNGLATSYHFDYGPTTGYGSSTQSTSAGSGTGTLNVNASLSGLTPGSTYHYRLVASSSSGSTNGNDQAFTTTATTPTPPPTVSTGAATNVTPTSAQINGSVNANGISTTYHFEYGPTASYGSATQSAAAGSGTSPVSVSATLSGLRSGAVYHYRLVAASAGGTVNGADRSLTASSTPPAPAMPGVILSAATNVTTTGAQLNGWVNPNGAGTSYHFEYGLTSSYGTSTSSASAGPGTDTVSVSATIGGLAPGSAYHCRLVAVSSGGTSYSGDSVFTTPAVVRPGGTPETQRLAQNYPNPFNPQTQIDYQLFVPGEVSLKVYNTLGAEVAALASGFQTAGKHSVTWDARGLVSGVYFCLLKTGGMVSTRRMIYVK